METNFLDLSGVHVFLTGASGGIGVVTAREFLKQGAKVTMQYHSNLGQLEELTSTYPHMALAVKANVADESQVKDAFSKSNSTLGPVQVLVVNHGIVNEQPVMIKDMSLERWNQTLDINLTGSFIVIREYMQQLEKYKVQKNVSLILLGSVMGRIGFTFFNDYAATKSAMMYGFMPGLKDEMVKICPRGRVNTVAPGWTRTQMVEGFMEDKSVMKKALATASLNKMSEPEDIARSILFLASEKAAGNITGQVLDVNGGMGGHVVNEC
ncbi:hypothetical protein IWW36_004491 [Coemansia brasiliensis]|uniref:Uncharacterized protein n=1 Tax=Coemansia brasiliensis TaxID=2650707 RepID=A0A9W8IAM9_9FUNG|nr:hypothetical protein IWW36_004491 [Coemansia brasiliensis]